MAYFAPDSRQMCLALDLWFTHTLSAGSWPVLQAINMIAVLYICVFLWLNPVLWLSLFFCSCNTESDWSQIHENIIKKVNSRYNLSGSNTGNEAVTSQLLKTVFINGSVHIYISAFFLMSCDLVTWKEVNQSFKRSFAYILKDTVTAFFVVKVRERLENGHENPN